jgi:hypothetical protein
MKFSDRRQKRSYPDALINVAAQHFFKTAPQRLGMAAVLSIFAPILSLDTWECKCSISRHPLNGFPKVIKSNQLWPNYTVRIKA